MSVVSMTRASRLAVAAAIFTWASGADAQQPTARESHAEERAAPFVDELGSPLTVVDLEQRRHVAGDVPRILEGSGQLAVGIAFDD